MRADLIGLCLPACDRLVVDRVEKTNKGILVRLRCRGKPPSCPSCSREGHHHSGYRRVLRDLPWQGQRVRLEVLVRRFRCRNRECPSPRARQVFSERITEVARPRARETTRASQFLRWVGYATGGRPAERLLHRMGLPISDNTVLRRVKARAAPTEPDVKVRVLGIDEWAWRKRQRYGTILMDLETRRVIDLLPVRSVASVAAWLRSHPEVEVITRDRSLLFADAGRSGASRAVQITDRYHLVDNLVEAVADDVQQLQLRAKHDWAAGLRPSRPWTEARRLRFRQARYERYQAVVECRRQGETIQAIATKLGLAYDTVSRFVRAPAFPERWIRSNRVRDERATASAPAVHRNFSPPRVAVLLSQAPRKLSDDQRSYLGEFLRVCPVARELRRMVLRFRALLRWRKTGRLRSWIDAAVKSGFQFVGAYAKTLLRDVQAAELAISVPWSNGPLEGHINRLKTIKRQMYGRAGFELLKVRVMPFVPFAA